MTITRSSAAHRTIHENSSSGRNLELRLLILVSFVLFAGLWLVLHAQFFEMDKSIRESPGNKLVNLNELRSSAEIQLLLGFYDAPRDRTFAANKIAGYLQDQEVIDSVSELRSIRITEQEIERTRGLVTFKERLKDAKEESKEDISIALLTAPQMRLMRSMLYVRTADHYCRLVLVYGGVFFLGFYALHAAWRFRRFKCDPFLLPVVHFLSGIGFLMMIRLRDPLRDTLLLTDFATGIGIGCILAFLASLPDYEKSPLKRLAFVPLLISFALSLLLFLLGSGPGLSDAKVNLRFGPIQFQPVELIKLLLLFFLAGFFADRWEFLRQLKQAPRTLPRFLRGLEIPRIRDAAPLIIAVCFAIAFFFLEKDLGPALVMTLLFISLWAIARSRITGALMACSAMIAAVWIGYSMQIPRTVSARLSMWLSPWDNMIGSGGDHLAQSLWSFATGGFWGTGLGLGDPAVVPAAHTDLIIAAIGEELGFVGLFCIAIAYAVLIYRAFRISACSGGVYSLFLGISAALLIALQVAFISAGILGIVPLSGVVTPFINYGKTSAISSFILLGILISLSRHSPGPEPNAAFRKNIFGIGGLLAVIGLIVLGQAARIQIFQADGFLGRGALIMQADGHRRYTYNPRLMEAMRSTSRGTIYDRNGIPLATNSIPLLESHRAQYRSMDVDLEKIIKPGVRRVYPFEALTFHFIGDRRNLMNWGAPNSSYIEREWNIALQGYDDRARLVRVQDRPGGPEHIVLRRDLRELMPLVRYKNRPEHKSVQEILKRKRDLSLSIDIRLQARVAAILEKRILASGAHSGAAIVIDPATGDLLASATYPWKDVANTKEIVFDSDEIPQNSDLSNNLLDRPRYGLYPPGSSFKLVTSIAALKAQQDAADVRFECKRLPGGRVGNYVRGWGKPIRDDIMDKAPHGTVDMAKGLTVSCNAYFAQLGVYLIGPQALLDAADLFGIKVASPNTAAQLKDALPQAAYGQGQVVVSPLQMARVAGAIGNQGRIVPSRIVLEDETQDIKTCLTADQAMKLSQYMRSVVTDGTGKEASKAMAPIAGKTGTAELRNQPAHAWFVGFAPAGSKMKKIAFGILIENGRYGGRAAAPAAAEIVNEAVKLGLISRE